MLLRMAFERNSTRPKVTRTGLGILFGRHCCSISFWEKAEHCQFSNSYMFEYFNVLELTSKTLVVLSRISPLHQSMFLGPFQNALLKIRLLEPETCISERPNKKEDMHRQKIEVCLVKLVSTYIAYQLASQQMVE